MNIFKKVVHHVLYTIYKPNRQKEENMEEFSNREDDDETMYNMSFTDVDNHYFTELMLLEQVEFYREENEYEYK